MSFGSFGSLDNVLTDVNSPLNFGIYANAKDANSAFSADFGSAGVGNQQAVGYGSSFDDYISELLGNGGVSDALGSAKGSGMSNQPDWMTAAFGGTYADGSKAMGYVSPLVGLGTAGINAYLGMENLGLAEDSLAFQKDAFSKQFAAQQTLTNGQLRDRQAARISADPNAYQAVDAYMKENGI